MTALLNYSNSAILTEAEKIEIDRAVSKNRKGLWIF